ncbi:hypothetical protein RJ639_040020 [Escallonia herrerae]|uniref:Reverse transcriptase Ty1/copia-type domain-containing protein n=1 Tax=Escallonia herrerae TaxID=1293975 RepID=A0AA89BCQ4_9ASTE|nr:hypothetical protein RJ639_040020 [Escallonia herrerae]
MKAYLQGQDLWDIVGGENSEIPAEVAENTDARKNWSMRCRKALFALRCSVHKDLIEHIRDREKPKEVWETLEKLFKRKNTSRLQMLENELANTTQENKASSFPEIESSAICMARASRFTIIDSGCSPHLTGDSSLFSHWNEYKGNNAIVAADNTVHPMVNDGSVKVKTTKQEIDSVTLNSVYHVPGMTKNLVSVSQISESGKYIQKGPSNSQDEASSSSSSIQFGARGDETSRDDVGEKENEEKSAQNEELQLRRSTRDRKLPARYKDFSMKKTYCHIYDMVVTCDNEQEVSKLIEELAVRFEMKNLGRIRHFLGLEVSICKDGIFLSQARYLQGILEKFKMADCKEASTPMDENLKLKVNEGKELPDAYPYRKLVGSLLYLTISRPDISYSVGVISQFMQKPRKPHLDATKRIIRYLKHTKSYGCSIRGMPLSLFVASQMLIGLEMHHQGDQLLAIFSTLDQQ